MLERVMGEKTSHVDHEFLEEYRELDEPGQPSILGEMIQRFFDALPDRMSLLEAAIEKGDPKMVRSASHNLKSTFGNVGAKAISTYASQIEEDAANGNLTEVEQLFLNIQKNLPEVKRELQVYLE